MKMSRLIKRVCLILGIMSICAMTSACGIYSYFQGAWEDEKLWEQLEASIDEGVAAMDRSQFHNARYQVKSRIIMSDLERPTSDHIVALFSPRVISEIGEDHLRESIEAMKNIFKGELLGYETRQNGGSGQRGGRGVTSRTYTIVIYTDMDIYELYLYYVTDDSSSNDSETNRANVGLQRMVAFPVSIVYGEEGLGGSSPYPDYFDREGVFYVEAVEAARNITYEGKGYTGYSIAVLQAFHYEIAVKKSCEALMELLAQAGFEGDIENISYTSEEDFADAYEAGYNVTLVDASQNRFFIQTPSEENAETLKIADDHMQVLYNGDPS